MKIVEASMFKSLVISPFNQKIGSNARIFH